MEENIEFSSEWLTQELIKTDFEEKIIGKEIVIRIKYKDLLRLFIKFIKMNKEV